MFVIFNTDRKSAQIPTRKSAQIPTQEIERIEYVTLCKARVRRAQTAVNQTDDNRPCTLDKTVEELERDEDEFERAHSNANHF